MKHIKTITVKTLEDGIDLKLSSYEVSTDEGTGISQFYSLRIEGMTYEPISFLKDGTMVFNIYRNPSTDTPFSEPKIIFIKIDKTKIEHKTIKDLPTMTAKELFLELEPREYNKFDRVENKMSERSEVHVMLLLDKLFPKEKYPSLVSLAQTANYDTVWLTIPDAALEQLTEDQITELLRCKVYFDESEDCLGLYI